MRLQVNHAGPAHCIHPLPKLTCLIYAAFLWTILTEIKSQNLLEKKL